ncbi:MAG: hypothetical protein AB1782_07435 [Cyanobacteriota bacterium]
MIGSALGIASKGLELGTDIAGVASSGKSKGKKGEGKGDKAGKILEALLQVLQASQGGKEKKAGGGLLDAFSELTNVVGGGGGGEALGGVAKLASKL